MNEMVPEISILIPAYNTAPYIVECIESVIAQTCGQLEIIIVDDGSTDRTAVLARVYALRDGRIKVVALPHQGVSGARNVCLHHAAGEYVLFVDSDDRIAPEFCANLLRRARATDADIVFSAMTVVTADGDSHTFGDRSALFVDSEVLSGTECFIRMVDSGCTYPMVAGNLYRREFINENHLRFDGLYHEDEYFMVHSLSCASSVANLPGTGYFYRKRNNSIMHDKSILRERAVSIAEVARSTESLLESIGGKQYDFSYRQALHRHADALRLRARKIYADYLSMNDSDKLIIVIEPCLGTQYGIGTYVHQLVRSVNRNMLDILVVELYSDHRDNPGFDVRYGQPVLKFPYSHSSESDDPVTGINLYATSVAYYLAAALSGTGRLIFHFNTFGHEVLAAKLRDFLKAKIVFTLHYTDWSFRLLGNKSELMKHLSSGDSDTDSVCENFRREQNFMLRCCDMVIAIARHSYTMLVDLYGLPPERLRLIYNRRSIDSGLSADFSRDALRKKYGFDESEKIIIFAGRIERVKGVYELIDAFRIVSRDIPEARLIIAGTGVFASVMERGAPVWSRITFTGFVGQEDLFGLYRLSDIGVVPSIHEEFGYVALEMALTGLPVLASDIGGLHELASRHPLISPILSDIHNPESFASEITALLNQTKGNQSASMNAISPVNSNSMDYNLNELYRSLIKL